MILFELSLDGAREPRPKTRAVRGSDRKNHPALAKPRAPLLRKEGSPSRDQRLPKDSDYRAVLKAFPEPRLAKKIFGTMENARIDGRLRHAYRGLRKDLDLGLSAGRLRAWPPNRASDREHSALSIGS